MKRRSPNAGLFNGFWLNMDGTRQRRIYRSEYGELYRLHRLCSQIEKEALRERRERRLDMLRRYGVQPLGVRPGWSR